MFFMWCSQRTCPPATAPAADDTVKGCHCHGSISGTLRYMNCPATCGRIQPRMCGVDSERCDTRHATTTINVRKGMAAAFAGSFLGLQRRQPRRVPTAGCLRTYVTRRSYRPLPQALTGCRLNTDCTPRDTRQCMNTCSGQCRCARQAPNQGQTVALLFISEIDRSRYCQTCHEW